MENYSDFADILLRLPKDEKAAYDEQLGDTKPNRKFRYNWVEYDEVLSLQRRKFTRDRALERMFELCARRELIPVQFFATRRHWCLRVKY